MKSDTRANFIFLIVLAVLIAPGAIIVTRKAIRGETQALRAMEPPPVRNRLAFMDPTLAIGAHTPFTPPITGDLVQRLTTRLVSMQPGLKPTVTGASFDAIMSDGFNLQLLGSGAHDGNTYVAVLGWNAAFHPIPTLYTITGTRAGSGDSAGTLIGYEEQNMPLEIRSELQDAGYIMPPDGLMWMIVSFPGTTPIDSVRLHYTFDRTTIDDTLRLTRKPATTIPATKP